MLKRLAYQKKVLTLRSVLEATQRGEPKRPRFREVAQLVAYTSGGRVVASSSLVFPTKKQGGSEIFVTTLCFRGLTHFFFFHLKRKYRND